jgi:hypothetical protein
MLLKTDLYVLKTSISMNINKMFAAIISAALGTLLIAFAPITEARMQRGYIKKNGTYVSPHFKSKPDRQRYNNNGSRTNGGKQRDEFSDPPVHNKSRNR